MQPRPAINFLTDAAFVALHNQISSHPLAVSTSSFFRQSRKDSDDNEPPRNRDMIG